MDNFNMFNLVNYLINKEQSGNTFNESEFQRVVNYNSLKLIMKRLGLPQEYQLQTSYVQQGFAETTRIMVDLADFIKTSQLNYVSNVTSVPTDMLYPISMKYKRSDNTCDGGFKNVNVELLNQGELMMREQSTLKKISFNYPIYSMEGDNFRIEPNIQVAFLTYVRRPVEIIFTTKTNATTGEIEYDAANSIELEWNDMAKIDIISMILYDVGVNLRAADIVQVANQMKQGQ